VKTVDTRDVALDIVTVQPPPNGVAMWWLGQASVVLRAAGATIYIDPFLSAYPGRLVPPLFTPADAPPADYVLCTHEHVDHFDPQTLPDMARSAPRARFVVPLHMVEQVTALGISSGRVLGAQPGEVLHLGPITLLAVPACHGLKAPPAIYGPPPTQRSSSACPRCGCRSAASSTRT
jgi:L-ascorbate 6-phosphate lactonase